MIGRFTTEDGDFYADPDGEMCLYQDYVALELRAKALQESIDGCARKVQEQASKLHQSDLNFDALEKQNTSLQHRLSSCENDLKTEREAVALSGRMHRAASDERDSYARRLDVLTKQLAAVCSVEHWWRSSDFHEKSSPHWICRHCGKQEPKDIDHWHDRERVVERLNTSTGERKS